MNRKEIKNWLIICALVIGGLLAADKLAKAESGPFDIYARDDSMELIGKNTCGVVGQKVQFATTTPITALEAGFGNGLGGNVIDLHAYVKICADAGCSAVVAASATISTSSASVVKFPITAFSAASTSTNYYIYVDWTGSMLNNTFIKGSLNASGNNTTYCGVGTPEDFIAGFTERSLGLSFYTDDNSYIETTGLYFPNSPYECVYGETCRILYYYNQAQFHNGDIGFYSYVNNPGETPISETYVASSTIVDLNDPNKVNGFSYIDIPPTYGGLNYAGSGWHFSFRSNYDQNFNGGAYLTFFEVNWTGKPYQAPPSTTDLLGTSTASIVCSADEWATPDPVFNWGFATSTVPAFNFVKLKCGVFKTALDIGENMTSGVSSILVGFGNVISNLFPISLGTGVYDAWVASETYEVPADVDALIPIDENNDIIIGPPGFISQFGATSSNLVVWGPGFANQFDTWPGGGWGAVASTLNAIFLAVFWLSSPLMWFLFLRNLIHNGKEIFDEYL